MIKTDRLISEVSVGEKYTHPEKGLGVITIACGRTVEIKFPRSTTKIVYDSKKCKFNPKDF